MSGLSNSTMNLTMTGQTALDFTSFVPVAVSAPSTADASATTDRPSREDRLTAAHAVLASGLSDVRDDPEAMARFLAFRARFHDYSLNNTVLIWTQNPAARFVKGYRAWQAVGRQVRRGETGITILAPVVRRATKAEIAAGADPDKKTAIAFRTATVFDYAQTDAVTDDALVYVPPASRL
ncbi:MAG TPA: ArdC family protein, partial [Rubricoccaceae bacterium]